MSTTEITKLSVTSIPTSYLPDDVAELLLERGENPCRPALENRVAFQWEQEGDTLGYANGGKKNRITLDWLAESVRGRSGPSAVLDVGCAYGNMMLMLNAKLGCSQNVQLIGVDLHPEGMRYAATFAKYVPGYANCRFQVADLTQRLPFADGQFDAVNLGDVLEHMEDTGAAVDELVRVTKPGGALLISTPLRDSLFKRLAAFANRMTKGSLNAAYYHGKDTKLDEAGRPMMNNPVGHDHISEMTLSELRTLLTGRRLTVERVEMMSVMSGSKWFDRHPFLLSILFLLEAVHTKLQFSSWAHSACLLVRVPVAGK